MSQITDPTPAVRADDTASTQSESRAPSRFATDLVPWLSSLLVDAGVAVLGLTLAHVVLTPVAMNKQQEIIPAATTVLENAEHTMPVPGAGALPIPIPVSQEEIETASNGTARDRGKSFDFQATSGAPGGDPSDVLNSITTGGRGRG